MFKEETPRAENFFSDQLFNDIIKRDELKNLNSIKKQHFNYCLLQIQNQNIFNCIELNSLIQNKILHPDKDILNGSPSYYNFQKNKAKQKNDAKKGQKKRKIEKKRRTLIEREGDWTCFNCKNLNFSFRTQCNRCFTPKDISDVQHENYMKKILEIIDENERKRCNENNNCS